MIIRHPRTTQELRSQGQYAQGEGVKMRRRKLPTSWDDQFPKHQRSWKERRKTKFRVVKSA